MFSVSLKSFLIFAIAVSASPIVKITSLPVTRNLRSGNIHAAIEAEKARAHYLQYGKGLKKDSNVAATPLTTGLWDFAANVSIGSNPPTTYTLMVDTDSANTWIGAKTPYKITSTSHDTGEVVTVIFPVIMIGDEYLDQVSLIPELVIANQSIGVARFISSDEASDGLLREFDGILALGPVALSKHTLTNDKLVPTITDNLYSQDLISEHSFALAFQPAHYTDGAEITWGGVDDSKHTGDVQYVNVTNVFPSSSQWGFEQTITYGSESHPLISNSAGIISSSFTWIHLSTAARDQYMTLTGAVLDTNTGLLTITPESFAELQSLFFNIGKASFEFTPNAQIFPRAFNTAIGGLADSIYLVVFPDDLTTPGVQFVLGAFWLERFYTVFDAANKQIGVATTQFTFDTTN